MFAGVLAVAMLMPVIPNVEATPNPVTAVAVSSEDVTREATYVSNSVDLVAAPKEVIRKESLFEGKAVIASEDAIDVFSMEDISSEVVGRLFENNIADVLEQNGSWTKITSGNVTGYVESDELCFGTEAEEVAKLVTEVSAVANSEDAKLYSSYTEDKIVVDALEEGASVVPVAVYGSFVEVKLEDENTAYVSMEHLEIDYGFEAGMTMEEVAIAEAEAAAAEAARKEAEEAAAQAAAEAAAQKAAEEAARRQRIIENTKSGTDITYNPTMEISDDDLWMLACIIDWESGWESYEGKLAVANVVLNRLRGGHYGSTVTEVVYAKGQFGGVRAADGGPSAQFAARLASGPRTEECMQAALAALSGQNNIEGYTSFIGLNQAKLEAYPQYVIIGGHCFH